MTANVAGQEWMGFPQRKREAGTVFSRQSSDIVGFQELGLTNWEEVFARARPDLTIVHGKRVGDIVVNSFAYRKDLFELSVYDTFWLSPDGTLTKGWDGKERGLTWGCLKDRRNGRGFLFLNTHLDNQGAVARIESVKVIAKFANAFSYTPTILTADSNVSVGSPRKDLWGKAWMRLPYNYMVKEGFVDTWAATHPQDPCRPYTFHAFKGSKYDPLKDDQYGTYDTEWIMVKGGLRGVASRLIDDQVDQHYPSDHYWMEATLEWD